MKCLMLKAKSSHSYAFERSTTLHSTLFARRCSRFKRVRKSRYLIALCSLSWRVFFQMSTSISMGLRRFESPSSTSLIFSHGCVDVLRKLYDFDTEMDRGLQSQFRTELFMKVYTI